jgi:hypothetical protein
MLLRMSLYVTHMFSHLQREPKHLITLITPSPSLQASPFNPGEYPSPQHVLCRHPLLREPSDEIVMHPQRFGGL